jgi:hypothetical protein
VKAEGSAVLRRQAAGPPARPLIYIKIKKEQKYSISEFKIIHGVD